MQDRQVPTKEQVISYMKDHRNWGRWGDRGGAGAINLITPQKRVQAAGLVKSGRTVSLSRPLPVDPSPENPVPVQHYMRKEYIGDWGASLDFLGIFHHGFSVTHIDALCHNWDEDGMWDGRDPEDEITFKGARWGSVDEWSDGILTRAVLLDVPKHRGEPYVTIDKPVHGWELEEILEKEGLSLESGDAVVVNGGRETYMADGPRDFVEGGPIPVLHASCMPFILENDVSMLVWDITDVAPNEYGLTWTVHGIIHAYGVAILDNALVEPLARACAEEGRYEFMLTVNPLVAVGGTGSPVNPIAVF